MSESCEWFHSPSTVLRDEQTAKDHETKNPERVIAGLKASIHNPTVSTEAKNHARARLHEMGVDPDEVTTHEHAASGHSEKGKVVMEESHHRTRGEHHHAEDETEEHRMLGGYKATLKNPHTSKEAKEHAKKVLAEHEKSSD
ncbi:hypothetical protein CPB84DRAFT_1765151 [Gymnopilus junonius]|uniref:Uncharacterized protein n=1 Tax=Gymnopilus junonius TaxID=109634 RepID=A0A9P5TRY3_GYMJU|nr:hypothetical protein CPB84DRAFT_1765151 [Gymnopilus junonius]